MGVPCHHLILSLCLTDIADGAWKSRTITKVLCRTWQVDGAASCWVALLSRDRRRLSRLACAADIRAKHHVRAVGR